MHRVRLHHPGDTPAIRGRLHRRGIPTYEADVRFAYRYLIDRGIKSALRIHGAARPLAEMAPDAARETVVFDEPEVEPARWTPQLTTLSLDIETDPEAQRLLSVALWGYGTREVLLLCPDAAARAACPAAAVPCASEADLLATLCRRVRALDPDVVTGWNIIDFDVPVLIRRAAELQVPLELGRAPGAVRQRGSGRQRADGTSTRWSGPGGHEQAPLQRFDLHPGAGGAGRHPPAARGLLPPGQLLSGQRGAGDSRRGQDARRRRSRGADHGYLQP